MSETNLKSDPPSGGGTDGLFGPSITFGAYTIHQTLPSPDEHHHLRSSAGLSVTPIPPSSPTYAAALLRSPYACVARHTDTDEAVGMVRIIGDGLLVLQICDMAVLPTHQKRGLGAELLRVLNAWCDENAPYAWVSLIGDPPGQALYKKMGFVKTEGIGMRRRGWGSWLPGYPWKQEREAMEEDAKREVRRSHGTETRETKE